MTLRAAVTLNFIIPRLQPGDPAELIVRQMVGQNGTIEPSQIAAIRAMLGTPNGNLVPAIYGLPEQPDPSQFRPVLQYFPYSVLHMIGQAMWWTIILVFTTQVIGFIIGNVLGAFAAWRRNSAFHSFVSVGLSFVGALPFFWIAMVLLYVFAFTLNWLPMGVASAPPRPGSSA